MNEQLLVPKGICITCQTNQINPMIGAGKSFCSRSCEHIWWRIDLQFHSIESIKKIALANLEVINSR
jgi:hypothetical protein